MGLTTIFVIASFNTQPPEGGCPWPQCDRPGGHRFQHTAARRRLPAALELARTYGLVSTHSRPKAAASLVEQRGPQSGVSTHSRPKAAAHGIRFFVRVENVSTHSRPKAAALKMGLLKLII